MNQPIVFKICITPRNASTDIKAAKTLDVADDRVAIPIEHFYTGFKLILV
jgi:hypothetical protein